MTQKHSKMTDAEEMKIWREREDRMTGARPTVDRIYVAVFADGTEERHTAVGRDIVFGHYAAFDPARLAQITAIRTEN